MSAKIFTNILMNMILSICLYQINVLVIELVIDRKCNCTEVIKRLQNDLVFLAQMYFVLQYSKCTASPDALNVIDSIKI